MADLAAFLLQRISEDEATARDTQHQARFGTPLLVIVAGGAGVRELTDPARWLAECDVKRRLVAAHYDPDKLDPEDDGFERFAGDCPDCRQSQPCNTLRLLALPYVDHPDYDETWRP